MADVLLRAEGVAVSFGGLQALENVSLEVREGSVVGLIGPNGAGKTTLFNVISGLQASDAGSIVFGDRDVTSLSANGRAGLGIGRSFQHLGLINDETVAVNLEAAQYLYARYRSWDLLVRPWRWWRDEARIRRRAAEAAAAFGLDRYLEQRVADLSFGVARFVELACVLIESPKLMLLDEPTTGLDVVEVAQLLRTLQAERAAGRTILLVAHDVRFVMDVCDYVYVLAEGRMLAKGTPEQVQRDPQVIQAYLGRAA